MSDMNTRSIKDKKEQILSLWEERCLREVKSARSTGSRALRDSLPLYLDHLDEALTTNRRMEREATRIGKMHGADRASHTTYTLSEVIFEYRILRQVLFYVLEADGPLTTDLREIVLDSIEQAVKDAVVEFTEVQGEVQQKFIDTLTHDLKTPIFVAKMNAQVVLRSPDLAQPATDSLKRILVSLNRVTSMIHDLLDGSRVRGGERLSLQFSECDLESLIREVVEEMTMVHGNRFVLDSNGGFHGDWGVDGLRRAVENLIGNAVKYGASGTPIRVSLRGETASVEITVHNEGSVISDDEIPQLFEKFGRSKSAVEGTQTGWGLGLTVVKGVVDAHRGKVRVQSAEGQGTSFTLEIPRTKAHRTEGVSRTEGR
ncbi:MAG: sensor histidine kinase [Nitrospira sp.]|nr:sensor histidine kinase [Nitrospira sp.]